MRTWIMVLVLMAATNVPTGYAFAQEAERAPAASAVFTPEQQEEARAALQMLGQAFGVTDDAAAPAKAETKAEPKKEKKTMADVADKALDAVTNAVATIAGKMEQVAPKVWEVMIVQQYAKAIGFIIVPFGLVIILFIYMFATRYAASKKYPLEEKVIFERGDITSYGALWIFTTLIPSILLVCIGIWFFNRAADSVMYVINPDYYAVKDLLQMLLKPGSV